MDDLYRLYCVTEGLPKTVFSSSLPTVCPDNAAHEIRGAYLKHELKVKFSLNELINESTSASYVDVSEFGGISKIDCVCCMSKMEVGATDYTISLYNVTDAVEVTASTFTNTAWAMCQLAYISELDRSKVYSIRMKVQGTSKNFYVSNIFLKSAE